MKESMVLKMFSSKTTDEESNHIQNRIQNVRSKISKMASRITVYDDDDEALRIDVSDKWVDLAPSVKIIECSLNSDSDCTIINAKFGKGGVIHKHRHNRQEEVFVVSGSLFDYVNEITIKEGSVYIIPPNKPHGFKSDYAKLTVVFRPPFPKVNV